MTSPDHTMPSIREATIDDLEGITEIYNDAILSTVATFDTSSKTMEEQREWFAGHGPSSSILVAELSADEGNTVVVGWASLGPWSDRCAYSDTAEISIYVADEHRGKGIAGKLMAAILREGKRAGFHTVIARISEGSKASIRLHESAGFFYIGTMREVGRKFGMILDVHMMQIILDDTGDDEKGEIPVRTCDEMKCNEDEMKMKCNEDKMKMKCNEDGM